VDLFNCVTLNIAWLIYIRCCYYEANTHRELTC